MIKEIKSRQNDIIKDVVKLSNSTYRKNAHQFKVDGYHLFEMARESNQILKIFTLKEIKNLDEKIPQYIVSEEIMKKISSSKTPQGIVTVCSFKKQKNISSNKVIYLDDVSDPGNLGTIFRTALAFGYNDIILSKNCCSIYNDKALQASQGAIFKLNICENIDLNELKNSGFKIFSTEIKGSVSLKDVQTANKIVLVFGNEAHGVSQDVLDISNQRIRIDIKNIESLNVAIASAIVMYKFSENLENVNSQSKFRF